MTGLQSLHKGLDKIGTWLNFIAIALLAVGLACMVIIVFAQVVFRFFHAGIPWSEEAARYIMIYLTFIGASVGVKYKSHIAVEALIAALPITGKKLAELVIDLLLLFAFYVLIRYGLSLVSGTMLQLSPAMRLPMGYIYFALPLGGILMAFHTFVNILGDLINFGASPKALEGGVE